MKWWTWAALGGGALWLASKKKAAAAPAPAVKPAVKPKTTNGVSLPTSADVAATQIKAMWETVYPDAKLSAVKLPSGMKGPVKLYHASGEIATMQVDPLVFLKQLIAKLPR
jgi:hypothetical protein